MFRCERCGSGFKFVTAGTEHCPRCRARDGVTELLVFSPFSKREAEEKIDAVRNAPLPAKRGSKEGGVTWLDI
jgi:hypothetical protein